MDPLFISEEYVLKQYTREMETFFKMKYKNFLNQFKHLQQGTFTIERIHQLRRLSWNLRIMMNVYLRMLSGEVYYSSLYIHHVVFQLNEVLTPHVRHKHSILLRRHQQLISRLLERMREKLYVNYCIYMYYNFV